MVGATWWLFLVVGVIRQWDAIEPCPGVQAGGHVPVTMSMEFGCVSV